jgi:hypothetical protein
MERYLLSCALHHVEVWGNRIIAKEDKIEGVCLTDGREKVGLQG